MTKKNFVTLILGTIGGILFALGMCMAMLPEWNAFTPGFVIGAVGLIVLLAMVMVRRKMEGKPIVVKLTAKTVGAILLGIIGTLALGVGMCMVMVWDMRGSRLLPPRKRLLLMCLSASVSARLFITGFPKNLSLKFSVTIILLALCLRRSQAFRCMPISSALSRLPRPCLQRGRCSAWCYLS